jgi:small conductance mechanosensitive channel
MPESIKNYFDNAVPAVLSFLIQIVIAITVLLVGLKIIDVLVKSIRKSLDKGTAKGRLDPGVVTFLCSLIRYALYFVLVMIILSQFGVTTGSVVAVLGSAGLTAGLALQGSLSNFAGGVLILLLKPFEVGDYIVDHAGGQEGTVHEITIFYTKLLTIDNRMVMIPNGSLSDSCITNASRMEKRRIDLTVGVAYSSDLAKVKQVLSDLVQEDPSVLKNEPIDIFVNKLGDSSIEMGLHVWVKNTEFWPSKWRLTENIKIAFDAHEISIPFPQLDVHSN